MNINDAARDDEIKLAATRIDDAMIHIKNICGYCGKCNLTKATCVVCKSYKKLDTAKRDLVELVRELEGIDWSV